MRDRQLTLSRVSSKKPTLRPLDTNLGLGRDCPNSHERQNGQDLHYKLSLIVLASLLGSLAEFDFPRVLLYRHSIDCRGLAFQATGRGSEAPEQSARSRSTSAAPSALLRAWSHRYASFENAPALVSTPLTLSAPCSNSMRFLLAPFSGAIRIAHRWAVVSIITWPVPCARRAHLCASQAGHISVWTNVLIS